VASQRLGHAVYDVDKEIARRIAEHQKENPQNLPSRYRPGDNFHPRSGSYPKSGPSRAGSRPSQEVINLESDGRDRAERGRSSGQQNEERRAAAQRVNQEKRQREDEEKRRKEDEQRRKDNENRRRVDERRKVDEDCRRQDARRDEVRRDDERRKLEAASRPVLPQGPRRTSSPGRPAAHPPGHPTGRPAARSQDRDSHSRSQSSRSRSRSPSADGPARDKRQRRTDSSSAERKGEKKKSTSKRKRYYSTSSEESQSSRDERKKEKPAKKTFSSVASTSGNKMPSLPTLYLPPLQLVAPSTKAPLSKDSKQQKAAALSSMPAPGTSATAGASDAGSNEEVTSRLSALESLLQKKLGIEGKFEEERDAMRKIVNAERNEHQRIRVIEKKESDSRRAVLEQDRREVKAARKDLENRRQELEKQREEDDANMKSIKEKLQSEVDQYKQQAEEQLHNMAKKHESDLTLCKETHIEETTLLKNLVSTLRKEQLKTIGVRSVSKEKAKEAEKEEKAKEAKKEEKAKEAEKEEKAKEAEKEGPESKKAAKEVPVKPKNLQENIDGTSKPKSWKEVKDKEKQEEVEDDDIFGGYLGADVSTEELVMDAVVLQATTKDTLLN
jgi:hypothetical protein